MTLAGGNPALLEQMVRIYHDSGVLEITDDFEDERWSVHADKLANVKLPLTVQDAVQARIAALVPEERQLLERAAAMGGVFWLGGLVAIHRQNESPPEVWEAGEAADDVLVIRQLLTDLVERDYVLRLPDSTFAGDEEYVFKHNLEREALVRLTPPASARRYHRAIAEWLTFRENADASEEYLEMLARHREKAGAVALAASSYVQAGEVARSRYANAKAAELFARGLAPPRAVRPRRRGPAPQGAPPLRRRLQALGRNDEAYRAFVEMLTRAWRLDLRSKGGAAHSRIGRLYRETGRLDEASRQLTAALALFGQAQDERGIASTLDDIGKLHWLKGDYALALEYTRARSVDAPQASATARALAVSLNNLGLVQQDSGNYQARARRVRAGAAHPPRDRRSRSARSRTLNNLGHGRAGHARRREGARALPGGVRRRQGDRRPQPHRAHPRRTSARSTTASATRRRPSRSSSRPRSSPTSWATSSAWPRRGAASARRTWRGASTPRPASAPGARWTCSPRPRAR